MKISFCDQVDFCPSRGPEAPFALQGSYHEDRGIGAPVARQKCQIANSRIIGYSQLMVGPQLGPEKLCCGRCPLGADYRQMGCVHVRHRAKNPPDFRNREIPGCIVEIT